MWPFTKREHDCKKHGHKYTQRYDHMIDPRVTQDDIRHHVQIAIGSDRLPRMKVYVRDICEHCSDVIERIEGKHPLEVLGLQAKR